MNKIRYINLCIVEFGQCFGMPAAMAFNYLRDYKALTFLDEIVMHMENKCMISTS